MPPEPILLRLEAEFSAPPGCLRRVASLLAEGATPHYLARYQPDACDGLGEEQLVEIHERLKVLLELEERKSTILTQAQARGSDVESLRQKLADCFDQDLIDDVYQTFRPRRAGEATRAEDLGLAPLALAIHHRTIGEQSLSEATQAYLAPDKGLDTPEQVLAGVCEILAEQYAGDTELRAQLREELGRGNLKAIATAPERKGANRYKEFFAFEQPVRRIPAPRMLALRKAEREGIVKLELTLPDERVRELFRQRFAADLGPEAALLPFLDIVFQHTWDTRLRDACSKDVRRHMKERADRETIRGHLAHLRAQLLAPPLGPRKVAAVRASNRVIWLALLDEDGSVATQRVLAMVPPPAPAPADPAPAPAAAAEPAAIADPVEGPAAPAEPEATSPATAENAAAGPSTSAVDTGTAATDEGAGLQAQSAGDPAPEAPSEHAAAESMEAAPHTAEPTAEQTADDSTGSTEPAMERDAAIAELARLLREHAPAAIAIPHGRRQAAAEAVLHPALEQLDGQRPMVVPVDETAASIHAGSPAARKSMPGTDSGMRVAIGLGRRLQDPMLELLAMEHRVLVACAGPHLGDVHQRVLHEQIDAVISSCIYSVGIDVNQAAPDLLERTPGLTRELAKALVDHRRQHGALRDRTTLGSIPGFDATRARNVAGCLRIIGGEEPLDQTRVHPDEYAAVRSFAAARTMEVPALIGGSFGGDPAPLIEAGLGELRARGVVTDLRTGSSDPRGRLIPVHNPGIARVADLNPGVELQGRVANVTDFGAFIDLGIGQDGLVHISQILPSRKRDPSQVLRVGEVIQVFVLQVAPDHKRISLTMFRPRPTGEERGRRRRDEPGMGRGGRPDRRPAPRTALEQAVASGLDFRRGSLRGKRRAGPGDRERPRDRREETVPEEYERAGGRRRSGGEPRVITVESERPPSEARGHKGEMRSLAALRDLLRREPEA